MMFAMSDDFDGGKPFDADYAATRQKWERLYEATQMKGDGETHPLLSPEDEFADFETWDFGNLDMSQAKTPEMLPGEYARSGLLRGLQLEAELGVNPFKFGLVGASDTHVGDLEPRQRQLLRQVHHLRAVAAPNPEPGRQHPPVEGRRGRHRRWRAGSTSPAASPRSGPPRTPATRSSTPWSVARSTPPPARASACASSAAGTSRPRTPAAATSPSSATEAACRWAPTCRRRRGRHRADLPRLRPARPDRRQPRPASDRQGLARRRRQSAGEGLRRRLVRRPRPRRRRQAAARRRHRRPRDPVLDQHHRCRRARRRLAGPRLRSRPARLLLRPRHRDPDPALDRLRRGEVRSRPAARGAAQDRRSAPIPRRSGIRPHDETRAPRPARRRAASGRRCRLRPHRRGGRRRLRHRLPAPDPRLGPCRGDGRGRPLGRLPRPAGDLAAASDLPAGHGARRRARRHRRADPRHRVRHRRLGADHRHRR